MKKLETLVKEVGVVAASRILDVNYHTIMDWRRKKFFPSKAVRTLATQKGIELPERR